MERYSPGHIDGGGGSDTLLSLNGCYWYREVKVRGYDSMGGRVCCCTAVTQFRKPFLEVSKKLWIS